MDSNYSTVVVGAGISGVRAALDLAETGFRVLLIDRKPNPGGILSQLDYQFPNDHCGMCRTLPMINRNGGAQFCLRKGVFHKNITFMAASTIESVNGSPGNLSVSINSAHTGVDPEKCTGCLSCEGVCPVTVEDEFNGNLSDRKAIYLPVPHNIPNKRVIDFKVCTKCGDCVTACPTGAITLDNGDETLELKGVGSVILATGSTLFDPETTDLYGMEHLKNVVTATSFERILSGSGPYKGKIQRPSDGKEIKKVAFIQCVGSRNIMIGADYCSSVCCMFALKEASLFSDKSEQGKSTIFCMDLRTFARDGERYKERVKSKGVRFVRSRIHSIEMGDGDDLSIGYTDTDGGLKVENFDLVVLSTGKARDQKHPPYCENEGVLSLSETPDFVEISESMINSGVASAKACKIAKEFNFEQYKGLKDETDAPPKIHVVLCSCGNLFKEEANLSLIAEEISRFYPQIGISQIEHTCSIDGWSELQSVIDEKGVNRLVLGACNPQIFSSKLSVNSIMAEIIDLREHIKDDTPKEAISKSIFSDIASSINRLKKYTPLGTREIPVTKRALVVGGGIAGISSALSLSGANVPVTIIEKSEKLGGNLPHISDQEVATELQKVIEKASINPNIEILFNSTLKGNSGTPGKFTTTIAIDDKEVKLECGSIIIATGGGKAPFELEDGVTTTFDLALKLKDGVKTEAKDVVIIQCKDSREEPFNYCSRICCSKALENAIKIKESEPDTNVTVLYRDIMAYGDIEARYTTARRLGVTFKRFDKDKKPAVSKVDGGFKISLYDFVLNEDIDLTADLLVYSTRVEPQNDGVDKILGLKTSEDGFIKETDPKFRPVDTGKEGIFICGLRRNPVNANEAKKEGIAAAQRALRLLNSSVLISSGQIAHVRDAICSRCNACVDVCPYGARYVAVEERKVKVDAISCQGCGTCASVCPNNATIIEGLEEKGLLDSIEAALL